MYIHAPKMAHRDTAVAVRPCGMTNRKRAPRYLHRLHLPASPFYGVFMDSVFQQVRQYTINKSVGILIRETFYAVFDGGFPVHNISVCKLILTSLSEVVWTITTIIS